jgi:hypothetical protein
LVKGLGGRHFALHDGAGNSGILTIKVCDDPVHPAFLARLFRFGCEVGPILDPIEAANDGRNGPFWLSPESI